MGFYTGINFSFVCYRLLRFLERHVKAFFNLVLILLVLGAFVLVNRYAFRCPCLISDDGSSSVPTMRIVYGSLFISVPPFIFWMAGILMHETTWRCLTGWRVQRKFTHTGRGCACFWYTIFSASLAPISWLVFVFLEGTYLECVMATVPDVCDGTTTLSPDQKTSNLDNRILSQVIACGIAGGAFFLYFFGKEGHLVPTSFWSLLLIPNIFVLLVYLLSQCCGSMTYYQKKYGREVNTLEEEAFEDAFKEYYNEEFKAKWKAMFNEGQQNDWQFVSELPPKNPSGRMLFSPFHAWKAGQIAPFPRSQPNPDKLVTVTVRSGGEWQVNKCAQATKLDDAEEKAKLEKLLKAQDKSRGQVPSVPPQTMPAPIMVPQAGHHGHLPPLTYPGPPNGYSSQQLVQYSMQEQKQQLMYTPRTPRMPAPQLMSDDPDDETPIVQPKKKTKKKKVKKSQVQNIEMEDTTQTEVKS